MAKTKTVNWKRAHDDDEPLEAVSDMGLQDDAGPIWVNGFSEAAARSFSSRVLRQSQQDPTAPIVIYIDSGGGDVYALLAMLSTLDAVPNQIITIAMGKAMSAGAMLLAYGDLRFASPHASIMIHEITAGAHGHIDDFSTQHANIFKLNEYVMKMLAETCKIKGGYVALKKTLAKARDLYMTAEEAKAFGLVDRVDVPTVARDVSSRYVLTSPNNPAEPKNAKSK
jgi:ATP-dependent Clp endopeptidase proteolytic subunit ClpP